ncbi:MULTISPECIES: DUF7827 domain-containing protein [Natrialbaceae]|uniref:DUF7827 domain-containing protein n=1 Tax=Natrialbaceae TaxID=1644061 RepID=UPI00207D1A9A|nr:BGTF surface domain-containing protein [Natronococcus sp. CG52]
MTSETSFREKGRAVFLAALMVLSVFAMAAALPGTAVADHEDETENLDSGQTYWAGQELDFTTTNQSLNATWNVYGVEGDEDTSFETQINIRDGEATLDTSSLDADEYDRFAIQNNNNKWVTFDATGAETGTDTATNASFTLLQQDLSVEFQADTATDMSSEVDINVDDDRGTQDLLVEADNLNGDDLVDLFDEEDVTKHDDDTVLISNVANDQTLNGNFTDVDTGEYTFTFTSADTGVSASDDIEIVDAGDVDAQFDDNSVSETLGDVAAITINLENTDEADLTIGGEDEGWMINATVYDEEDDGEVTVYFNTAAAGDETDVGDDTDVLSANGNNVVDVDTHESLTDVLATGSYDTSLEVQGDQKDRGTLNLQEGSVDSATVEKANGGADYEDAEELREYLNDDSEVAEGDLAVIEVAASGIYGYDLSNQGIDVTLEQTEPGMNQDPVELTPDDTIYDQDSDQVYYVIDTSNLLDDDRIDDGEEFTFTFEVDSDKNDFLSEDADLETAFTVNERTVEFTEDEYELENDEGQEISGTSNFASGAEVDVTAQTGGDHAFFSQKTAEVDENGDWTATFDFSHLEDGVEFDLTASDVGGDADDAEATGAVSEADDGEAALDVVGDAPSEVDVDEDATLDVTVTNDGDEAGNATLEVTVGDEEYSEDLELEGGESETFSYDFDTSEEGDIEWTATVDDASDSGTLTVEAEDDGVEDDGEEDDGVEDDGVEDDGVEDDDAEDDEAEDDGTEDDGEDDDSTPGFGVAVALVALLAAAMLALRRQN